MKILFDTHEQMEDILNYISIQDACPHEFGLESKCSRDIECYDCWKQAVHAEVVKK